MHYYAAYIYKCFCEGKKKERIERFEVANVLVDGWVGHMPSTNVYFVVV